MAKFTATVPLKIRLPGGFEIDGATGATHRIPDALYDEFVRDQVPLIPGGVTWVSQDETSAIVGFDPSTKYDKTGGTISGAVTVTGALVAQSTISAVGAISGASASVSGAVTASTLTASGRATVGAVTLNGGGYTNTFDTDVWISGANRTAATGPTQGYYGQHRITGNAGAAVHDALAAEIRLNGITNATFLNAIEATVVVSGGAVTIPDTRAVTANVTLASGVSGTVTATRVIVAQAVANSSTATLTTVYGIYAEAQTAGTTNYNIYAPTGTTHLGIVESEGDLTVGSAGTGARNIIISGASAQNRDLRFHSGSSLRWILRIDSTAETGSNAGSDFSIIARTDAGGALVSPLSIKRSNGAISIANVPIGFYGSAAVAKQTVTGAKGSNAALGSLMTALSTLGLVTDSTTA